MRCDCGSADTRVLSTRTRDSGVITRRHACQACGARYTSLQLPPSACASVRYDLDAWERRLTSDYTKARAALQARVKAMRQDRLAGMSCPQIAKKYAISEHMARYYTRIPRDRLYPAVKARAAKEKT